MKLFNWQWFFPLHLYQANVAAAIVGGAVVGGLASNYGQRSAANTAAGAQTQAAQLGIDENRRQFDSIQALLAPYVKAGGSSLTGQQDLIGLNGAGAQTSAIDALQNSPMFGALAKQGEDGILQNASATGGLRGGNVQGALAQFRPSLLSALIDQQYSRLGGITSLGQNAAVRVGNAGMQTGNAVTALLQQQGDALSGAALAGGRANAGMANAFGNSVGMYYGLRGQPNTGGSMPSGPAGQYYTGGVAGDAWNSGYDLQDTF